MPRRTVTPIAISLLLLVAVAPTPQAEAQPASCLVGGLLVVRCNIPCPPAGTAFRVQAIAFPQAGFPAVAVFADCGHATGSCHATAGVGAAYAACETTIVSGGRDIGQCVGVGLTFVVIGCNAPNILPT